MYWMRTVDNVVHRYVTRAWSEAMGYLYVADLHFGRVDESEQPASRAALDQMDAKTSGTLTHISDDGRVGTTVPTGLARLVVHIFYFH